MKCKNLIFIVALLLFIGCSQNIPKPDVKIQKQTIDKTITSTHFKILEFKEMIENDPSIEPIFIHIQDSLISEVVNDEIPNIKKTAYSVLMDFGTKVNVIASNSSLKSYLSDSNVSSRVFLLDGAITSFDEKIESQSSSVRFNLSLGSGDNKTKNKDKFKNKKAKSQLIGDFYFKQNGMIKHKTSSSIFIREVNEGYSFGLSLYGLSLGASAYKNMKDGLGLSVRKVVQASMIDLVAKAMKIKTFQVIPQIQAKKRVQNVDNVGNVDFCSDMNKLVFYTNALRDKKFNSFGISYESEKEKLRCLYDLYGKEKGKVFVKLLAITNKDVSLSKAQQNVDFLRKKINEVGIKRSDILINNKRSQEMCQDEQEYCELIGNKIEIQKIVKR